jgi:hypothetical protein
MAWIELHQELVEHKKMDQLVRETGVARDTALGRLCILWLWALSNRPDGRLDDLDQRRLGQILNLSPRKAGDFREALVRSGFLDRQGEELRIHDWEDYTGRLLELKRRDRERKRQARSRLREGADCPPDSAGTSAENPPLPNPTLPDPTQSLPDNTQLTSVEEVFFDPAAHPGVGAGAGNEKLTDYLLSRGLLPELWYGSTRELIRRSRVLTDGLFRVFCSRKPNEVDYAKVFPLVTEFRREEKDRIWMEDWEELLGYAFEQAALNGAAGNWPYIEGVLGRLRARGIKTRDEALAYDRERDTNW